MSDFQDLNGLKKANNPFASQQDFHTLVDNKQGDFIPHSVALRIKTMLPEDQEEQSQAT